MWSTSRCARYSYRPNWPPALKAQSGALGLTIIRQYRDEAGLLIAVSESVYPADRFTLTMQMKRDKH